MPPESSKPSSFVRRFTSGLNWLLVQLRVEEVPHIKRIIVTVVGGTIVIFGVILIVTPGPAILVIPVGFAILGTEYAWARRWLRKGRRMAQTVVQKTQETEEYAWARRWLRKARRMAKAAFDKIWGIFSPAEPALEKPSLTGRPEKKLSVPVAEEEARGELVGTAAGKPDRG